MPEPKHFLFCDLETTGSKEDKDFILEASFILFDVENFIDLDLSVLDRSDFLTMVIGDHSGTGSGDSWRDRLWSNKYVLEMHLKNGLLEAVEASELRTVSADIRAVTWLSEHPNKPKHHEVLLAGSGVSHFDRRFLKAHMPETESWLMYPNLDQGSTRRLLTYAGRHDLLYKKIYPDDHRAGLDNWDNVFEAQYYMRLVDAIPRDVLDGRINNKLAQKI